MRKAKIFSAISLILLCTCIMFVGVLAASNFQKVEMGGIINIPVNKIGVTIKGYISETQYTEAPGDDVVADYDSTIETSEKYENTEDYITEFGSTWNISANQTQLNKLAFDLTDLNVEEELSTKAIYITFVVTNSSEIALDLFFTRIVGEDVFPSPIPLKDAGGDDAVSVTFSEKTTLAASTEQQASTAIVSIKFVPLKFVETTTAMDFEYTLNAAEEV